MAYNGICPHLSTSVINVEVPVVRNPSEASNIWVLGAGSNLVHRMKFLNDRTKLVIKTEL